MPPSDLEEFGWVRNRLIRRLLKKNAADDREFASNPASMGRSVAARFS